MQLCLKHRLVDTSNRDLVENCKRSVIFEPTEVFNTDYFSGDDSVKEYLETKTITIKLSTSK